MVIKFIRIAQICVWHRWIYWDEKCLADPCFKGLKRLEYRGYDSAGVALFQKEQITLIKKKGKIGERLFFQ